MADDEIRLRAIIEAEDRSQQVFNDAKKRSEDLVKTQLDLNARLNSSMTTLANGQQKSNMKAAEFYGITKDLDKATKSLAEAQKEQAKALHELDRAHDKAARAQATYARQHKSIWEQATADIKGYAGSFVGVAAAVEVVRRSISEFAQFERGMARIEMQTGATNRQMANLGHSVDALARETGQTVAELQKSFQTFSAEMGSGGDDVVKMFKEVQQAAFAAGTSFETMSRTAVTAVKTMNVPMSEIKGMLDTVVKDIPASAMQAWDNVAPRILGIMRSLGATGKDSVGQAANAFGVLSNAMGSAQLAGTVFEQMMKKATSTGDMFGRIMIPQMIALQGQTGGVTKQWEAMYREMERFGIFSENKEQALYMQQKFGFSDEMVRGAQEYHKVYGQIVEAVAKGEAWDTAEKRLVRLSKGPQAAVDDLKGALGELWTVIGSVFGGTIPSELAKMVTGLKNDIERIQAAFAWIRQNVTNTESPTGERFGAGSAGQINQANPNGRGAVGEFLFGGESKPQLKSNPPPTVGGRRTGRYPGAGFATGGSFEVGGEGGIDTTPVGFMATRGERVDVTTPMQESLQQQQDKADIAMREHFARFHGSAFTKTTAPGWWPGGGARPPGAGGAGASGASGAGGIGGTPGGGGGRDGSGGNGPDNKSGNDPPNTGYQPPTSGPGYNVGPGGKPMPAWGTEATDPGGKYWGGMAGGGAAGGVPGLPGGPSGRALTKEERDAQNAAAGAGGGGGGAPGGGDAAFLANFRKTYINEINNNPKVRNAVNQILNHESDNVTAKTAVLEAWMTRAARNGDTSLMQDVDRKFFGPVNRGEVNINSPASKHANDQGAAAFAAVSGGSNLTDFRDDQGTSRAGTPEIPRETPYAVAAPIKVGGEHVYYHSQASRNYADRQRAAMIAARGAAPAGPASTALGPDALPAPGTVPVGSKTTAGVQGASVGAGATTGTASAGAGAAAGGSGAGVIKMMNRGAIRDKPLSQNTTDYLEYASLNTGLEVHVGSGGQPSTGRKRTGSHRHDDGGAADYKLWDPTKNNGQGGYLDMRNGADRSKMQNFVRLTSKAGATGQGAGLEYMGAETIHTGGGTEVTWKSQGQKGGFVYEGHYAGKKERLTPTQLKTQLAELRKDRDTKLANKPADNKSAAAPTNTKVATAAPATGQKTDDKPAAAAADPRNKAPSEGKAEGGDVTAGRPYVVGENGPEMFVPGQSGAVKPNDNYARWNKLPKSSNIEDRRGDQYDSQTGEPLSLYRNPPRLSPLHHPQTGAHIGEGGSPLQSVYGFDQKPHGSLEGALRQYRELSAEMQKPIQPNMTIPRAGPIRQRMSRHVESQRERDVGRMTRHASHSDIGFA